MGQGAVGPYSLQATSVIPAPSPSWLRAGKGLGGSNLSPQTLYPQQRGAPLSLSPVLCLHRSGAMGMGGANSYLPLRECLLPTYWWSCLNRENFGTLFLQLWVLVANSVVTGGLYQQPIR